MDLIDRQALLKRLAKQKECFLVNLNLFWGEASAVNICADIVRKMPTAQPTRSELRRMAIQQEVFPQKRGECDTCSWHNACNWETLMKDWNIEHGYCAAYCSADMRGEENG